MDLKAVIKSERTPREKIEVGSLFDSKFAIQLPQNGI